jgi:hypothetical protein
VGLLREGNYHERDGDVVRVERHCPPAESTERCAGDCGGRTHAVRRDTDSLLLWAKRARASAGVVQRPIPFLTTESVFVCWGSLSVYSSVGICVLSTRHSAQAQTLGVSTHSISNAELPLRPVIRGHRAPAWRRDRRRRAGMRAGS